MLVAGDSDQLDRALDALNTESVMELPAASGSTGRMAIDRMRRARSLHPTEVYLNLLRGQGVRPGLRRELGLLRRLAPQLPRERRELLAEPARRPPLIGGGSDGTEASITSCRGARLKS